MSSLINIAQQLKSLNEPIILIFAFNSMGKTRLSVEYKNIIKTEDGIHNGVYYNAYSEDLFVWDNDEENNNANIKLRIIPSRLNKYHSFLIENPDKLNEKLECYKPIYSFELNPHINPEEGIESITFSLKTDGRSIKISRGEEKIFVWCFFLALIEVDEWTSNQNDYFFIDDPVSSLDEQNIFITADSIFDIIKRNYLNGKIIIATHHIGLYAILFDKLKRGDKCDKFKNNTKTFILSKIGEEFELKEHNKDVFLFHLHLMQILNDAIQNELFLYHFVLLRQLIENISSFIGSGKLGFILSEIKVDKPNKVLEMINSLSHQNSYRFQFNKMAPEQEAIFKDVFNKIKEKYNFKY
ncbi:MAG: AAA family ATPase [Candidatus Kapabacteria bacterium]|nr:AAA family ATPase [Candidatus Kapabacteria bacterium]